MENNLIGNLEHCHEFDIHHRPVEWVTSSMHVLMLVASGIGELNWKEDPDRPIPVDGTRHFLYHLPPDSVRFVDVLNDQPMHIVAVRFSLAYEDGGDFCDCYRISEQRIDERRDALRASMLELLRLKGKDDRAAELETRRRFLILQGTFLEAAELLPVDEFKTHLRHCGPAVVYLRRHYAQPLDIDRLAKLCGVSRPYFFALFHGETGMTAQQYQRRERLIRARKLLLFTRKSVAEIGDEVGWSDPFHFSRIFTRETGYSPAKYRRMMIT